MPRFTPAQIAVIERMAAEGYPKKTVAAKLGVPFSTLASQCVTLDIRWAKLPMAQRAALPELVRTAAYTPAALDRAKEQLRREIAAAVADARTKSVPPYRGHLEDFQ